MLPVSIPCAEFLQGYSNIGESIAAYGGPDWRTSTSRVGENDGKFGAAVERTSVTGSPVVPGSALKVLAEADQVLYAVTVLKGHYQIGVLVDGVFTNGKLSLFCGMCDKDAMLEGFVEYCLDSPSLSLSLLRLKAILWTTWSPSRRPFARSASPCATWSTTQPRPAAWTARSSRPRPR